MASDFDADVVVIGSGFGGSVAALRFAEAGHRVLVLERGDEVTRKTFEPDLDMFWDPPRQRFGMNQLRRSGRNVVTWTGSAVGGGSNVYAATLKRVCEFDGFPSAIREDDLAPYYTIVEDMLGATEYPSYPPYSDVAATQLLLRADARLERERPDLVEGAGRIRLGISFAPPGGHPGQVFTNRFGVTQRYADPRDQSILGGDIGSKNSLDRNYLVEARRQGVRIESMCEADRIRSLPGGGWEIEVSRLRRADGWAQKLRRRWSWRPPPPLATPERVTGRVLVVAAGSLGSTELLLRNRELHGTLDRINEHLGERYTTNGDSYTLLLEARGLALGWLGTLIMSAGLVKRKRLVALLGAALATAGSMRARKAYDPDLGPTNSDYIRFVGVDGQIQGVYIEGGRYPNPIRWVIAAALGAIGGYRPTRYPLIALVTDIAGIFVPPLNIVARSLPIPLLTMGRDDAVGRIHLDKDGRAEIEINLRQNDHFYSYGEMLGRLVADAAGARWMPNPVLRWLRIIDVPHNLGGVPMGEGPAEGVVDDVGRVFGVEDLVVLDGSIIPRSLGPNPSLTIAALAERAMPTLVRQLADEGHIRAIV